MRRMSFAMTTDAILNRTKTVTRRVGWNNLKIGERLQAVDKLRTRNAQKLAVIEVVSVRREQLGAILQLPIELQELEVEREGFGALEPRQFVALFCESAPCIPGTTVNRIEFRYVEEDPS